MTVHTVPDLSLSAATKDLKMSTRWSKGTHCGASSRSAASDAGRPATAAVSLQMTGLYLKTQGQLLALKHLHNKLGLRDMLLRA